MGGLPPHPFTLLLLQGGSDVTLLGADVSFMDGPTEPVSLQPAGKANILVQGSTVAANAAFSKGNFSFCGKREERVKMDEQG